MKEIKKSPLHLVDALFVGWFLIIYHKYGHSSMSFAVLWISLITTLNVLFVIFICDVEKMLVHQEVYIIYFSSQIVCAIALYFRYLKDRKYAHALVESYRGERKWAWYARVIAILYFISPAVFGAIHLYVNGNTGK